MQGTVRLYFAGNIGAGLEEILYADGMRHRLLSFAEIDSLEDAVLNLWLSDRTPERLFLDSGAFGALTRGAEIDLQRYIAFIKEHERFLGPYASLDVIGQWKGSAHNDEIMRNAGLRPMPAFHMGSPDHELRRLLGITDYLALGGVVGAHENQMRPWLDKCFRIIRDFWPKKIHVFGVMAQWCLERYPLYSADSSGAIVGGGMGRISRFDSARIDNYDWKEYGQRYYDGDVMDHVATVRGKSGSAHYGRRRANVQAQLALQRFITDVWIMRGITWKD